jgi:peptide/nickel transport system substrate-binding protein
MNRVGRARPAAVALAGIFAVTASVAAGGTSATPAAPRPGGTLTVGIVPEPRILNMWIAAGGTPSTLEVVLPTMDNGLRYDHRTRLVPLLLDGQPRIVRQRPFTVRFSYKQAARWNDGTPVTGNDFVFAWQTAMNPRWSTSRTWWEEIRRVQVGGRRDKTVTVTFRRPYANWRWVAGGIWVLPRHALDGENFEQVWRNDVNNPKTGRPISNGPFLFESWERGKQLVLARNPNYWRRKAYLDRVVYRFFPNQDALLPALRAGEIDMAFVALPLQQIAAMRRDRRFRVQSGQAYSWEHIDLQQGPRGHPALKRRYVRRAIITAINRRQIARSVYGSIAPGLPVLNNAVFKPFETQYRPNWRIHRFGQQRAINLLRRNGCTGGPARPGGGGTYSCPDVGRLSFRFSTTLGNAARELTFRIIRAQLSSIGIELQPNFVTPAQFVNVVIPGGDWDLIMFTFLGNPLAAINATRFHGCGGASNFSKYCDPTITTLLNRVETTSDDAQRTRLLNRADALMARDVALIPLFSLPNFVIHQTRVRGALRNPTGGGMNSFAGNAGNWWLAR